MSLVWRRNCGVDFLCVLLIAIGRLWLFVIYLNATSHMCLQLLLTYCTYCTTLYTYLSNCGFINCLYSLFIHFLSAFLSSMLFNHNCWIYMISYLFFFLHNYMLDELKGVFLPHRHTHIISVIIYLFNYFMAE